jgi:hypothetical protein
MTDTRYVDYSYALVGLKPSSLGTEKYGVEDLARSGVLAVIKMYYIIGIAACVMGGQKNNKT